MQDNSPSVADIREADRIVYECLDHWADPRAWQIHLLARTAALVGMQVGLYTEVDTLDPDASVRVLTAAEHGWEDRAQREAFTESKELVRREVFVEEPLDWHMRRAMVERDAVAFTRADVIDASAWEASDDYRRFYEPLGLFESIRSAHRLQRCGTVSVIAFAGDRQFTPGRRERELVAQIHQGVAVAYRDRLASWAHVSPLGLTPRQQEVFQLLLTGETEQVIASRLHRTRPTVNEHIKAIYRHFGVNSRSELFSYLLARTPTARAQPNPPGVIH